MKAVRLIKVGQPLEMQEIPVPVIGEKELCRNMGKRGSGKFIAYKGIIYDVICCPKWKNELHENFHFSGQDLTSKLPNAPHQEEVFNHDCVNIVGRLAED